MRHAHATIEEEEPAHISSYQTLPGTNNLRNSKPGMKLIKKGVSYANQHMQTNTICEHKWSEKCLFRQFFIWGSPYANFSCANSHRQIPICKSPFTNKYCSKTLNMNFMCIWSPRLQMVVVCIYGD
jgi:hypothetical protein